MSHLLANHNNRREAHDPRFLHLGGWIAIAWGVEISPVSQEASIFSFPQTHIPLVMAVFKGQNK